MASRIWMNIPDGSVFNMKLTINDGSTILSASGIYDPIGPSFDAPWDLQSLIEGVDRAIDGDAEVNIDVRYLKPESSVVEIQAGVKNSDGVSVLDTSGATEFRQLFTGSGPGGRTELAFYLYQD